MLLHTLSSDPRQQRVQFLSIRPLLRRPFLLPRVCLDSEIPKRKRPLRRERSSSGPWGQIKGRGISICYEFVAALRRISACFQPLKFSGQITIVKMNIFLCAFTIFSCCGFIRRVTCCLLFIRKLLGDSRGGKTRAEGSRTRSAKDWARPFFAQVPSRCWLGCDPTDPLERSVLRQQTVNFLSATF